MLSKTEVLWERINSVSKVDLGVVSWSRYLTKKEVEAIKFD
jgi:hypothetical protein